MRINVAWTHFAHVPVSHTCTCVTHMYLCHTAVNLAKENIRNKLSTPFPDILFGSDLQRFGEFAQALIRDAPQKRKRENVGILKKQGGVYPNPISFVI